MSPEDRSSASVRSGAPSRIAHIVHPVTAVPPSDLAVAQPITFETMHVARQWAGPSADVSLYAVQYHDEKPIPLPESFVRTRALDRSVGDIAAFCQRRKLALIKDILDILYESCTADYLIYTNVDIALQPHFYQTVAAIIQRGHDAFAINRRTIPGHYRTLQEIPLMYAEAGEKHPGWDCFVFQRSLYPQFMLGNACIGTDWIGRMMITNMAATAKRFKVFKDLHVTFHIGDQRVWKSDDLSDYAAHNKAECRKTLDVFDGRYGPFDRKRLPGRFFGKFDV